MAIHLVPETYATINLAIAACAASGGDTISVAPGTYNEICSLQTKRITLEGRDPTNVAATTIEYNGSYVVALRLGSIVQHLTILQTNTSSGKYCVSFYEPGCLTDNCHLKTNGGGVRFYHSGGGSFINGCVIESLHKGVAHSTWGIRSDAIDNIYSCLVLDFNHASIYTYGKCNVVNTTVQSSYNRNSYHIGIYGGQIYNCINRFNSGAAGYAGITGLIRTVNCISYAAVASSQGDFSGPAATNSYDSNAVANWSGPGLFVDEPALNFNINAGSIAEDTGTYIWQTANGAPTVDLNGATIDPASPDIGAYQVVSGGGARKRKMRLRLRSLKLKL